MVSGRSAPCSSSGIGVVPAPVAPAVGVSTLDVGLLTRGLCDRPDEEVPVTGGRGELRRDPSEEGGEDGSILRGLRTALSAICQVKYQSVLVRNLLLLLENNVKAQLML